MILNPVRLSQLWQILIVFFFASVGCTALLVLRKLIFGDVRMGYLVWNLFLAWIPLGLAVVAGWLWYRRPSNRGALFACAFAWLMFYPNAPYIFTDIIHLRKTAPEPVWYDLIVTSAFALTGFLIGFTSLYLMQRLVARMYGWQTGWSFVVAVMGLSGFGIYLGRFARLNSWDVVSAPWEVLVGVYRSLKHPFSHHGFVVFAFVTGLFLFMGYVMVYSIMQIGLAPSRVGRFEKKDAIHDL